MRDDGDGIASVVNQVDSLAFIGQAVADFAIVGIDGDGKFRWVAAAEED